MRKGLGGRARGRGRFARVGDRDAVGGGRGTGGRRGLLLPRRVCMVTLMLRMTGGLFCGK